VQQNVKQYIQSQKNMANTVNKNLIMTKAAVDSN